MLPVDVSSLMEMHTHMKNAGIKSYQNGNLVNSWLADANNLGADIELINYIINKSECIWRDEQNGRNKTLID